MELYTEVSYQLARRLTDAYSTSFGWSIRLFPKTSRRHVYALYGLVRAADEIVDTYRGSDASELLEAFIAETYAALERNYSTNPIIHAFVVTANEYAIDKTLIEPFFDSMRRDLQPVTRLTQAEYDDYIHGSAEVIGLIMIKLFTDKKIYDELQDGAKHLGAAYQKINFLRDIKADHTIGRWYFPISDYAAFDQSTMETIIKDIEEDLAIASPAIRQLPKDARSAVALSESYYRELLGRIKQTPASELKERRIRVPNGRKLFLMTTFTAKGVVRHA
jgi:phytoene/squalene synthetase